ncbi:unnamed protein product [Peronospora belbahrii]|uniref:Crinkler effector protein N-terminal domain-containing protein n=1 Tax=Peronospora belbahrii TaxID=622444 RepID=A0AAU9L8X4_9STRA|nr:unnamed protein product [Peronospora belbahrii]
MVKLFCAIVGVEGSVFSVDIDATQSVADLKDAIRLEKPNDLKDVDADRLQLFLAKKDAGVWLSSRSEDVTKLKRGQNTALVELLTGQDQELQGEDPLQDLLNGCDPLLYRQVHVLVIVPQPKMNWKCALQRPFPYDPKDKYVSL